MKFPGKISGRAKKGKFKGSNASTVTGLPSFIKSYRPARLTFTMLNLRMIICRSGGVSGFHQEFQGFKVARLSSCIIEFFRKAETRCLASLSIMQISPQLKVATQRSPVYNLRVLILCGMQTMDI